MGPSVESIDTYEQKENEEKKKNIHRDTNEEEK